MLGNDSLLFGIGLDTRTLQTDANRAKGILGGITQKAQQEGKKIDNTYRNLAQGVSLVFSSGVLATFVGMMAKTRGEFQQLEVAFTTMLGSKAKADELMAKTVEFAAKTPFDLQGVANGTKQLLAYGSEAQNVTEELSMLGNIASGLSMPLNDLVYLYGTTRVQGQLYLQDLKQFQNRGIPIVAELAKQYNVSEKAVSDLVSAGKVGFADVERAMKAMTSEGAMFYNLMEEQSKTITGKMSNLGDAVSQMFNKLGESQEGAMSGVLDSAVYLVENYEKVAKIVLELIGTYGVYKAALITTAVAQKAAATLAVYDIASKKINTALTWKHTRALIAQKIAQIKANAAMMVNPYVIIAAAIAGLVYVMYKLITAQTAHEKAVENVNNLLKEQAELLDEQKAKAEKLIGVIQDEVSTITQKQTAYENLQKLFPDYFGSMDIEEIRTLNLKDAYKKLNEELENKSKLQREGTVDENIKKIAELEELKKKFTSPENVGERSNIQNDIDRLKEFNKELKKRESISNESARKAKIQAEFDKLSTKEKIEQLKSENAMAEFQNKGLQAKKEANPVSFATSGQQNIITTNDEEIRKNNAKIIELNKSLELQNKARVSLEDTKEKIVKTQAIIDRLSAKGRTKEGINETENKQLDDSEAELERLKKQQEKLENKPKESTSSKAKYDEAKIEQDNARTLEDIAYKNQMALLATKKDGAEKEFEILKAKQARELIELQRQKEDRLAIANAEQEADKEQDFKVRSDDEWEAYKAKIKSQYKELKDLTTGQQAKAKTEFVQENYEKELQAYADYAEAYISKKESYDADLKAMRERGANEETITEAEKIYDDVLAGLAKDMEIKESIIKEMAIGLLGLGLDEIMEQLSSAQESLKSEKEGSPEENRTEEQKKKIALLNARIKVLLNLLKKKSNENAEDIEDTDWKETVSALHDIMETANDVIDSFDGVSDSAKQLAKTTINTAGSAIALIGTLTSVTTSAGVSMSLTSFMASESIKTVEKASVILAIISAALQVAMAIASLFNKDKSKEKDIVKLQVQVDKLKKSYDALEKAIDDAYGTGAAELIQQQEKVLKAQIPLLEAQIRKEKDKKKTDSAKVQKYRDAIDEINEILAESEEKQVEAIIGTSVSSAIDDFASAYADAWTAGEDKAKAMEDVVKKMVRSAINEMIKMRMSGHVEAFANYLSKAIDDGVITSMEENMLNQLEGAILNTMSNLSDTLDPYMVDEDEDERTGLTGGFKSMSQDTGDELNGRFTVIQGHTFQIVEGMKSLMQNGAQQLLYLSGIRDNTSRLESIEKDMSVMRNAVTDLNDIGIKIR